MKYIKNLILNDYLDSDSLKGIKIKEINSEYSISQSKPEQLLKFFNIIMKNKNTIDNGFHVMNMIMSSAHDKLKESIFYKKNIDPILEEIISSSVERVVNYLILCKKEKFKTNLKVNEKELINTNDPYLIMEYIKEIKKTEFKEAESLILKSANIAIQYCADYIKEPWKELEEQIEKTNDKMLYFNYIYKIIVPFYKKEFKNQKLRSLIQKNYANYENKIMNANYEIENVLPVYTYSKEIIGGRWLEFEKMVEDKINSGRNFNDSDCYDFFEYMFKIYSGRWKIAEPYFINLHKGFPQLKKIEDYINEKVIPEYKKNLNTFEDLQKYKDEFNMWDKLMNKEIVFIFNPVYMFIKLRDLVYYYDKKIVQNILKEYFPLNYKKNIEPVI